MSAPAPALAQAPAPRRTVTVRLADAALTIAFLSLVFGLLLVSFPVSFARIIQDSWLHGNLTVAMMVITLSRLTHAFTSVSLIGCRPSRQFSRLCA